MHAGGKLEQPPCVSIGVPVRNGEAYLDRALASLLAQDFTDFEVLICDNVSTDRTVAIADAWAAKDSRVKVFRNEVNIGAERNFSRVFGPYHFWNSLSASPDFSRSRSTPSTTPLTPVSPLRMPSASASVLMLCGMIR